MSDTQSLIGKILETEQSRDAIHIAVAALVAAESLKPGDPVGLDEAGNASSDAAPIGIVDPFLAARVRKGQRFFLFLYPNTITSLRHNWSHPSFDAQRHHADHTTRISHEDHKSKSEAWIAQHASDMGLSTDVLMGHADEWMEDTSDWPDYHVQQGSERWRDTFNPVEFWHHYEIVTGKTVPENKRRSLYCCTC
jgi:hypothetical protein